MKPNRVLPVLALIVILGAVAGCSDHDPAGPHGDGPPVVDLEVGNTWRFLEHKNTPGATEKPFSRVVARHETISHSGRTLSVAVEIRDPDKAAESITTKTRLLRNEPDGLYDYGSIGPAGLYLYDEPLLVAPREGHPGDRFTLGPDRILECVAADSLVTTPFGEVEADVYRLLLDEGTVIVPDIYVVPEVGLTLYYETEQTVRLKDYDFD